MLLLDILSLFYFLPKQDVVIIININIITIKTKFALVAYRRNGLAKKASQAIHSRYQSLDTMSVN